MAKHAVAPDFRTRDRMMTRLRELQPALEAEGVRHVAIFGSVARGDDVPESDLDVIVDLDPEREVGLFAFVGIGQLLEREIGRHVDVMTRRSIRPGRHDGILAELREVF